MNATQRAEADRIASSHGCTLVPAANKRLAIQVLGRYQQGFPQDDARIEAVRADAKAAGLPEWLWLS